KKKGNVQKVIVAGCLAQREGAELFEQVNGIDAVVGLGSRDLIANIIKEVLGSDKSKTFLTKPPQAANDDRTRLRISPAHWAYLRISEGCDHNCSFCTIPAIKGRFRSKPQDIILAEAAELVGCGAAELNIIAQDTAYYGRDLKIKDGLALLAGELEKIDNLKWLRLMYMYPAGINDYLIETIRSSEKIVHYLDIPIQHINNEILKNMHRPDTKDKICSVIENLRSKISDIVLRTTVIVGFPGETDEQFGELLEFVKWAKFDALGCFKFYPESGTPAAQMPNQIPEKTKSQRLEELMLAQQEICFAKNKSRIGEKLLCLIDSVDSAGVRNGRFYGQAPEIDSICVINNCSAKAGDFIEAEIVGTKNYDLIVRPV
ncbi:MAG: 30S ribosomal protein S12 methylthiotransferase RimO, partial [Planctomycetes bacterium]|nr:30S ribosomal protein S12 methylthiotransferase RimO [Planctomycetota bacterium]